MAIIPFRIKSNVAFERWRTDRRSCSVAIPRRLSRLSFHGNLCLLEDHLRTTNTTKRLRHRIASVLPARCSVAQSSLACLASILYANLTGAADAPGAFRRRILPFTWPTCLSQPDRNDYGTACPPFARSRLFLPALIRSIVVYGFSFSSLRNHSDRENEWLNQPSPSLASPAPCQWLPDKRIQIALVNH